MNISLLIRLLDVPFGGDCPLDTTTLRLGSEFKRMWTTFVVSVVLLRNFPNSCVMFQNYIPIEIMYVIYPLPSNIYQKHYKMRPSYPQRLEELIFHVEETNRDEKWENLRETLVVIKQADDMTMILNKQDMVQ
jgi:hypothetical protein